MTFSRKYDDDYITTRTYSRADNCSQFAESQPPYTKKNQNNSLFLPFHKQVVKVVYRSVHSPLFINVHKFLQQILHNPREQGVLLYNTTLLHSHTLYFKGFKGIKAKYKIYKFCTKGFS